MFSARMGTVWDLKAVMSATEFVIKQLERISGTDQIRNHLDLDLFDEDLLDSLGTMELMVALTEEFGISLSPAQINRQMWATPRKIIAYVEERINP